MTMLFRAAAILSLTAAVLPAQAPVTIGPGVISIDGRNETFPAIDPVDGSLWFSIYDQNFDQQTIMRAAKAGDSWGAPEHAPFSGEFGDRAPRFSPDGRRLYFTSNRPAPGHPKGDMNIWMVERAGGQWGAAVMVPAPVSVPDGRDIHNVVLADGTLIVGSHRPGGAGRSDFWRIAPGKPAQNLGAPINDERSQPDLYASPDGQWMVIVVTDHPQGLGGDDLFYTELRDGAWTPLRHLGGEINSREYEYGPWVSPDGKWLYFTSHRGGSADVYRVEMAQVKQKA